MNPPDFDFLDLPDDDEDLRPRELSSAARETFAAAERGALTVLDAGRLTARWAGGAGVSWLTDWSAWDGADRWE
jgi:hypothetical protein